LNLNPNSAEYGNPVEDVARISLGNAHRLRGAIASAQGDQSSALDSMGQAIQNLEMVRPTFEESVRQHESYRRYLAQLYEYLGEAYQWQGYIFELQQDYPQALENYDKALDAYAQCIAQGDPNLTSDLIIQNDIVGGLCQPYYQDTKEIYDNLKGTQ
jgi:tetratricopeptide (TPR) repeat protein